MNSFWQELITQLGGFAIFAGALAWLTKSIITHFPSKDVEKYKTQLAYESAREMEEFKAQLQITIKEHDVRFNKLHEKRAEVISELYGLLNAANMSLGQFEINYRHKQSHNLNDRFLEKSAEIVLNDCARAFNFFRKHQIYLSKGLSELIEKCIFAVHNHSLTYRAYQGKGIDTSVLFQLEMASDLKNRSSEISQILEMLENEFRLLLGSETKSEQTHPPVVAIEKA